MGTIKYYNPKTDRYQTAKILGINGNELDCFFPKSNLIEGIEYFNEDVYSWELRDNFEIEVFQDGEYFTTDQVESDEQAREIYPSEDGYTFKVKESN